jgi:hypothetical protein
LEKIASHAYVETRQVIDWTEKKIIESWFEVCLYEDKISTAAKEYPLRNVFDISYRPIGDSYGFLYLHTNEGVKTLCVKSEPKNFLERYKEIKI